MFDLQNNRQVNFKPLDLSRKAGILFPHFGLTSPEERANLPDMQEQDPFLPRIAYYILPIVLGGLASFASLLGSSRLLAKRVIISYVLCGGLVSLVVVLLMVEQYGESAFLLGWSVCAGFKALDILAMAWVLFTRWFNFFVQSKTGMPAEDLPALEENSIDETTKGDDHP